MIKINLPNPREMTVLEFFAQMKIALKSAEKSYEEIIKSIDLKSNEPWISFRMENIKDILGDDNQSHADLHNLLDNFICEDDSQEIYLEIDKQ